MRNVNINDYYKRIPEVPAKTNSRFWTKADRAMRQAGLKEGERAKLIGELEQLIETEGENEAINALKSGLPAFSWKKELSDFPYFFGIYWLLVFCAADCFLTPLMDGTPIRLSLTVTLGMVVQTVLVYFIYKGVLWVAAGAHRGLSWWLGIIGLFALYLTAIYASHALESVVLFHVSTIAAMAVFIIMMVLWHYIYRRLHDDTEH